MSSVCGPGLDASESVGDVLSHENTSTVNHDEASSTSRSAVVKHSRVSVIRAQALRFVLTRWVFAAGFVLLVFGWGSTWVRAAGNEIARNALLFGLPAFVVIAGFCFYVAVRPGEAWE